MKITCDQAHEWIWKGLLDDLPAADRQVLERHLEGCPVCRAERNRCETTLGRLKEPLDEPVPRHFFVYPEGGRTAISPARRTLKAAAVVIATFGLGAIFLAGSGFQMRSESGIYSFSFGKPLPPLLNEAQLKQELLEEMTRLVEREDLRWAEALQEQLAETEKTIRKEQRQDLARHLNRLDQRWNARAARSAAQLQGQWNRSLQNLYESMELRRRADLSWVETELNRVMLSQQLARNETGVLLEALLQVADFK